MKVAYIFATGGRNAPYKLGRMILPQLEEGRHGAEVVGMFFSTTIVICCARAIRWASGWARSRAKAACC